MPSDFSIYLIRFSDEAKVFRFPTNNGYLPGLYREGDFGAALEDDDQKWLATACGFPGDPSSFTVAQVFDGQISMSDHRMGQLVLVSCNQPLAFTPKQSVTFAEMIRALPADKNRIAYIKAMQWINMPKDQEFAAVEVDDEIKGALRDTLTTSSEDQHHD